MSEYLLTSLPELMYWVEEVRPDGECEICHKTDLPQILIKNFQQQTIHRLCSSHETSTIKSESGLGFAPAEPLAILSALLGTFWRTDLAQMDLDTLGHA